MTHIDLYKVELSIRRQWALIGLNRATVYDTPVTASAFNLQLLRLIDALDTRTPCDGGRRMTTHGRRLGRPVHPTRVQRLMRPLGRQAIHPEPCTSPAANDHTLDPSLLVAVVRSRSHQGWRAEIP